MLRHRLPCDVKLWCEGLAGPVGTLTLGGFIVQLSGHWPSEAPRHREPPEAEERQVDAARAPGPAKGCPWPKSEIRMHR